MGRIPTEPGIDCTASELSSHSTVIESRVPKVSFKQFYPPIGLHVGERNPNFELKVETEFTNHFFI